MKVVQLVNTLDVGGMERLTVDLAVRQRQDGHESWIFCTNEPGPLAKVARQYGVPVLSFGVNGFSPRLPLRIASELKEIRADVLHTHNPFVVHHGVLAARLAGVPAVFNTRHGGNLNPPTKVENRWRRYTRWTDGIVFVSEGVRQHFLQMHRMSTRNTHVIYNGIEVNRFESKPATPARGGRPFRFGTVARLVPAKDHVTMVKAFALVSKKLPDPELHILGTGPCEKEIEATAKSLGVSSRVVLHGHSLDVPSFLADLDLFVMSSVDEGLPIALMEAMAAGLPAVLTRLPGLMEIAPSGASAFYCEPRDPAAMAEVMMETATRPDLAQLGADSRQRAKKFDISESWGAYRTIFEEALRKKGRN